MRWMSFACLFVWFVCFVFFFFLCGEEAILQIIYLELNAPWYQGRYHTLSWIWQKETPSTEKKQGIIFFYPKMRWMSFACLFVWFVCFVFFFFLCGEEAILQIIYLELNAPWYQGRYHTLSWIWQKETPSTEKKQGIIFFYPKMRWMSFACLFVWFVCFVLFFFLCGEGAILQIIYLLCNIYLHYLKIFLRVQTSCWQHKATSS